MTTTDYESAHAARLAELSRNAPPIFHVVDHSGGRKPRRVVSDRGERFDSIRAAAEHFHCRYDTIQRALRLKRPCEVTDGRRWAYERR